MKSQALLAVVLFLIFIFFIRMSLSSHPEDEQRWSESFNTFEREFTEIKEASCRIAKELSSDNLALQYYQSEIDNWDSPFSFFGYEQSKRENMLLLSDLPKYSTNLNNDLRSLDLLLEKVGMVRLEAEYDNSHCDVSISRDRINEGMSFRYKSDRSAILALPPFIEAVHTQKMRRSRTPVEFAMPLKQSGWYIYYDTPR